MKTLRTQIGPFSERPYFTDQEIERMCSNELRSIGLLPSKPEPIRIERFIEKRFGVSPDYDDLPAGILGFTRFRKSGVQQIVVARSLDDSSTSSERRVRSTLAHEAGHGLLHGYLFAVSGQSSLFPEGESASPRVLCRDEHASGSRQKYSGEWWEYQANRTIGGFLLPRTLTVRAVDQFLVPDGLLGLNVLPPENRALATNHLADVFDVNPAVATIHLGELFPQLMAEQRML